MTTKNKILALLLFFVTSLSFAQDVGYQAELTGNIITNGPWAGAQDKTSLQLGLIEGCCSGPTPVYNTSTDTLRFSYSVATVSQKQTVGNYVSGQDTMISGFRYDWQVYNDKNNPIGTRGNLNIDVILYGKGKNILDVVEFDYSNTNTGANFNSVGGLANFDRSYALSSIGEIALDVTGKDQNFWGGYYGPRLRDPQIKLRYETPVEIASYYKQIAGEWQQFTLTDSATIRYGMDGQYIYKTFQPGTYSCSFYEFNKDPAGGVEKACYAPSTPPAPSVSPNGFNPLTNVVNNDALKTINNNPAPNQAQQAQQIANQQQPPPEAAPPPALAAAAPPPAPESQPPAAQPQQQQQQQQNQNPMVANNSPDPQQKQQNGGGGPAPNVAPPSSSPQQAGGPPNNGPAQAQNTPADSKPAGPSMQDRIAGAVASFQAIQAREQKTINQTVQNAAQTAQNAVAQTEQTALSVASREAEKAESIAKESSRSTTSTSTAAKENSGLALVAATNSSSQTDNRTNQNFTAGLQRTNTSVVNVLQNNNSGATNNNTTANDFDTLNRAAANNLDKQQNMGMFANPTQKSENASVDLVSTVASITIRPVIVTGAAPQTMMQETSTESAVKPPKAEEVKIAEVDQSQTFNNYFVNRSNPMYSYIERNTQFVDTAPVENKPVTVKTNVQDNELANGVKIDSIAVVPVGYSAYTAFFLRDAMFYEPKDIYKNVTLKDNARSMFFLEKGSSDTYKKMLESQYK